MVFGSQRHILGGEKEEDAAVREELLALSDAKDDLAKIIEARPDEIYCSP